MFRQNIVFIVSAGASAEVGIPVGADLRDDIANATNIYFDSLGGIVRGDQTLYRQIKSSFPSETNEYFLAGRQISEGIYGKRSIDEYLEWHKEDAAIVNFGKSAIARSILKHEAVASKKWFGSGDEFMLKRFEGTWYSSIFELLTRGYEKEEIGKIFDNVKFVIFNYDRCLEFFLYNAIQKMGLSADVASRICSVGSTFYHPYGMIAPIFGNQAVPFGGHRGNDNYIQLSKNIKTYSEQEENEGVFHSVKESIADAQTLVFLGFSYNQANVELLRPHSNSCTTRIFGTAHKISKPNIESIKCDLHDLLGQKVVDAEEVVSFSRDSIVVQDITCGSFFVEYGDLLPKPNATYA